MKYERLARSGRRLGRIHTLWLAEDHLLAVESTSYSEEYTRYYFKDIQALISRRSAWGAVFNAIAATLAVISVLACIGGYEDGPSPMNVTAASFGGFFLVLLLWNLFLGTTCSCHVRTTLGVDELPALDRTRSVKRVLKRLRPLIGRLQGEISGREIVELAGRAVDMSVSTPSPAMAQKAGPERSRAGHHTSAYGGGLHRAAFLLLVADGALSLLQTLHNTKFMVVLSTCVSIAFLFAAVIALVRQHDRPVSNPAKWITWGGLAAMVSGSVIGYFFMIFLSMGRFKSGAVTQDQLLDFYAAIEPAEHPSYAVYLVVYAVVVAAIGTAGLIALDRERRITERRRK